MIVKTAIGPGLSGMQRYVMGRGRDENGVPKTEDRSRVIGGDGFGFPVTEQNVDIARRMMEQNGRPEMQASNGYTCANDGLHMKLSWAPGQTPSQQEIREAARGALGSIGMERAMHTIVQHTDKHFAHAHVVASRIDPETGKTFDDNQRVYRTQEWALRWEEERNQITKDRQWCHDIRAMTKGEPQNQELANKLFENEATLEHKRLKLYMAWGGHFQADLKKRVNDFVQDNKLLPLKQYAKGKTAAYTTEEIWKEEAQTLATIRRINEQKGFEVPDKIIDDVAREMTLTPEQRKALRHATQDNGMGIIVGKAGSGKSHTMTAIRKAYERAGYPVKGYAETNRVVQQMQAEGMDAATIASEVQRLKFRPDEKWKPKSVVPIDEAGQMETARLKEFIRHIEKQGAKPLFIGDPGQLGAVKRGGLLRPMIREHGAAKLDEVMRTKHADQKQAYVHMSKRRYKEAVDIFKESSIKWSDNKEESIKALVDEYQQRMKDNPKGLTQVVAGTNDEVKRINDEVRALWKADGRIKNEHDFDTAKGPRQFGVGDRIAMNETPNAQDKKKGLINGAFGSVTGISVQPNGQKEITVDIDRKPKEQRRQFKFKVGMNKDEGEVSGIDHGYAGTVYKAQGSTYDHTLKLHNPKSTAPTNYVGLTRHKDKVSIHVSRDETAHHDELVEQLKHGKDKTSAHDYFINRDELKQHEQQMPTNKAVRGLFSAHREQEKEFENQFEEALEQRYRNQQQAHLDVQKERKSMEPFPEVIPPNHEKKRSEPPKEQEAAVAPMHDKVKEWIQKYVPKQPEPEPQQQRGEVGKELEDHTLATTQGQEIRKQQSRGRSR